ncbi:MAG: hypothetical protein FJ267_10750 [Planctomycetes bacterium]|nr:hypothetical protein [Planctomycetota bacterium]
MPLITVIKDAEQPLSVKLISVLSLARVLRSGTPTVVQRTRIAEALQSELKNKNSHWWYQRRLVGALTFASLDDAQQPGLVKNLVDVVKDEGRDWRVRAEAGMVLGRIPLPASSNPQSVVKEVGQLAVKAAAEAQKTPNDPKWTQVFWTIYLAFHAADDKEKDGSKTGKAGMLNNPVVAQSAKATYEKVLPIVIAFVVNKQPPQSKQVSELDEFLKGQRQNQEAKLNKNENSSSSVGNP